MSGYRGDIGGLEKSHVKLNFIDSNGKFVISHLRYFVFSYLVNV